MPTSKVSALSEIYKETMASFGPLAPQSYLHDSCMRRQHHHKRLLVPVIFLYHDATPTVEVLVFGTLSLLSVPQYCTGFHHIVFHPGTMTTHLDASDRAVRHNEAEYSAGPSVTKPCFGSGDSDTKGVLPELASCPDWNEIEAEERRSATVFPEPEGDGESLAAISERLYTPINGLWQTRILQLFPGSPGSPLHGRLSVADIVLRHGLGLHANQGLVSYDALSYSCGEPILARRIYLQDESFPISENLYLGLQSIRKSQEPMVMWVDAICIHQANEEEKSQQVVNMLDIYLKADCVHVWLGPCRGNTEFALSFLSAMKPVESHVSKCPNCLERLLDGIKDVFTRSWFRRTWVKQEIYAAKQITTHCGQFAFTGDFVEVWVATLRPLVKNRTTLLERRTKRQINKAGDITEAADVHLDLRADQKSIVQDALRRLQSFRRATPQELLARQDDEIRNPHLTDDAIYSLDIINVMRRCSTSECGDLQDHIYALLGMTNLEHYTDKTVHRDGEALIVDYTKSVARLFEELTRHIIRRDDSLAVLCLEVFYGPSLSQPSVAMLPSWVPDLRFLTFQKSWLQNRVIREHYCSDQYSDECRRENLTQQRHGYTTLRFDKFGWPLTDGPGPIARSVLGNLPANQLRLAGRSVGRITFGREPDVADGYRFASAGNEGGT
jgi:hypothetical protein